MFRLSVKANAFTLKNIFSKIDRSSAEKIHVANKLLLLFGFIFLVTMFLKIYISNLVVIEAKNVDSLKYRLKITESELKKIKKELSRYSEKDVLLDYSKNFQDEEKIELVVVKE